MDEMAAAACFFRDFTAFQIIFYFKPHHICDAKFHPQAYHTSQKMHVRIYVHCTICTRNKPPYTAGSPTLSISLRLSPSGDIHQMAVSTLGLTGD